MKNQLIKIQKLKAKIQKLIKLVSLGIKKYIVELLDAESLLETAQKEQVQFIKKTAVTTSVYYKNVEIGEFEPFADDCKVYYLGAGLSGWEIVDKESVHTLFQDKAEELYLAKEKSNNFWGTNNIKMENKKSRIVNASECGKGSRKFYRF